MTDDIPDYSAVEPPDGKAPETYSYHERRGEIFDVIVAAGSPTAVTQARLAERYDVAESTISNDMDRLRESVSDHLGTSAKLTTRTVFEKVVDELLEADDWRAKKAAFDTVMEWNEWLQDVGEQHREPDRVEADVRERSTEVQYRVVRGETADAVAGDNTTGGGLDTDDGPDYEALGFTEAPADVAVESVDDTEGD